MTLAVKESLEITKAVDRPRHVAIILDGNRRWSERQQEKVIRPLSGHWVGTKNLYRIVKSAISIGIEELTLFGFSTENWRRSPTEVEQLLGVIAKALSVYGPRLIRYGIRLRLMGDLSRFPPPLQKKLLRAVEQTAAGDRIGVNLALNYGGRDELVRAARRLATEVAQGRIAVEAITENLFSSFLDTAGLSDPDLLIRTSGEDRISNFLLWQIAYTEFYTTPVLWPDFSPEDLYQACLQYQARKRRLGA